MYERRKNFFVYITASKARGVLYVGMSSDLPKRAMQHRDRLIEGFAKKYWVGRLVYYEAHSTAEEAVQRERLMKRWRRDWKIALIENMNPTWRDLLPDVLQQFGYEP